METELNGKPISEATIEEIKAACYDRVIVHTRIAQELAALQAELQCRECDGEPKETTP